ncbi:MAG: hypothetical protein ABIP30_00805 [Ferruginibacter sp.]
MKRIIPVAVTLLITFCANAQTDTTGRSDLAYLFQNLNSVNIPTGYLVE